ncbi:MAG TPA: NAD(P)H-binding protein [Baekduia sp.]
MTTIVTGAAGRLGRLVTEQLLQRVEPEELVLVTRHPGALREVAARGVQVRRGDFDEPASLPDAFAGGRKLLLISTDAIGHRLHQHQAAIDAAEEAGVEHVVFTSMVNPVAWHPMGAIPWEKGMTEGMLRSSAVAWTMLRFGSFAEQQIPPAATAVQNGRLVLNFGSGRIVAISRRDCAEAAAVVLTTAGHEGQTYDITGSEPMDHAALAALYAELSGKPVEVVRMTDVMLVQVLVSLGTPMKSAWDIVAFGRAVRLGFFDVVDPLFEQLVGRPPDQLRDVLVSHRADLLGVG